MRQILRDIPPLRLSQREASLHVVWQKRSGGSNSRNGSNMLSHIQLLTGGLRGGNSSALYLYPYILTMLWMVCTVCMLRMLCIDFACFTLSLHFMHVMHFKHLHTLWTFCIYILLWDFFALMYSFVFMYFIDIDSVLWLYFLDCNCYLNIGFMD